MCFGPFERVCNWGPLTALAIVKTITLTTLHCSRLEPRLNVLPLVDLSFLVFMVFSALTLYHFVTCMYEGPGFLPFKWLPKNKNECQFLQFCNICQGYKAPRSHHCRKCGRCVLKMDHHCPWINNCVGHKNHGNFTAFLASSVLGCFVSTYIMSNWLASVFLHRNFLMGPPSLFVMIVVLFSIGLSIGVILAVGMLLCFQVITIFKNQTGIEAWILEKANYRRMNSPEKFIYPYAKSWLFNVKQVVSWKCQPVGDGIHWPVVEGCDQYTLTREQIAQKIEKRQRSRRYRVVNKYSGSWLPISHGIKVLCSPPITDEPRIKIKEADIIVVTRWRKHWLFGEKESTSIPTNGKDTRVRGWFPRICVIEVIEKDCEFDYDFLDDNLDARIHDTPIDKNKTE